MSLSYFVRDNEKYFNQINITKSAEKGVKEAQGFNEKMCINKPKSGDYTGSFESWKSKMGTNYIELQYHGKLTMGDVESITFKSHPSSWVDDNVLKQIKAFRIKIYYIKNNNVVEF